MITHVFPFFYLAVPIRAKKKKEDRKKKLTGQPYMKKGNPF
jgi:hypothetical protein